MEIKYFTMPFLIVTKIYLGISFYLIAKQNINDLVICANTKIINTPFSKNLCRGYLYSVRGTKNDIKSMQQAGGISFVIGAAQTDSEKRELVKFFTTNGLNINGMDVHGIRPLQLAVLEGSIDDVRLLIEFGANPSLGEAKISSTPLALAKQLHSEKKLQGNGDAIVAVLRSAVENAEQNTEASGD